MKRLMLGLALAGPLGAADCPALLAQLERQRDEPAVALATYRQADEELCFSSPSMADSQRRALLARWEERLFRHIFAGAAIDMENPQSRRLVAAGAEIRQGASFVSGSEDWPMLLLLALLDVNTQYKDFTGEEMQQRLDSVIAGYLRAAEADRLPDYIPGRLGEFLLDLRQTQLLLIKEEEYQQLKHKRGGGDSELTRLALLLMKNRRGGVLSSSEEQPAGLINKTPIRFKYNSVELNPQRPNIGKTCPSCGPTAPRASFWSATPTPAGRPNITAGSPSVGLRPCATGWWPTACRPSRFRWTGPAKIFPWTLASPRPFSATLQWRARTARRPGGGWNMRPTATYCARNTRAGSVPTPRPPRGASAPTRPGGRPPGLLIGSASLCPDTEALPFPRPHSREALWLGEIVSAEALQAGEMDLDEALRLGEIVPTEALRD